MACENREQRRGQGDAGQASGDQVSELTTNRLSVYLRCLNELEDAGVRTISSQALAEQFHLNAAQIRKDLAYFGEFGVRGVGYYVRDLKRHLRQILGLDRKLRVAIIGAGNLGPRARRLSRASARRASRSRRSSTRCSDKVGQQSRGGVPIHDIHDLKKIARRDGISIAVIAVPAPSAQHVVDLVVAAGIKAILNFSPGALQVPRGREAEERRPDGLAREPVVLSWRRESRWRVGREADGGRRGTARCRTSTRAGRVRMVDVGDKPVTDREAVARGSITMSREALRLIRSGAVKKGDPLQAARLAGIMAAKQTAALIPLCHPLPLSQRAASS